MFFINKYVHIRNFIRMHVFMYVIYIPRSRTEQAHGYGLSGAQWGKIRWVLRKQVLRPLQLRSCNLLVQAKHVVCLSAKLNWNSDMRMQMLSNMFHDSSLNRIFWILRICFIHCKHYPGDVGEGAAFFEIYMIHSISQIFLHFRHDSKKMSTSLLLITILAYPIAMRVQMTKLKTV